MILVITIVAYNHQERDPPLNLLCLFACNSDTEGRPANRSKSPQVQRALGRFLMIATGREPVWHWENPLLEILGIPPTCTATFIQVFPMTKQDGYPKNAKVFPER